jgi:hypothetical protein
MIIDRTIQDQTVRAECAQVHARRAGSVLDIFENLQAGGMTLSPGTQIRFGWSLFRLLEDGTALRVSEPDFALWPEQRWNHTIDTTLRVQSEQTHLLQFLDVDGQDTCFDQKLIAAEGALAQSNIYLRRRASTLHDDSGWLLATPDDPEALTREEGLEGVFVAHLVMQRPALLQALALPTDFIVVFSGDTIQQIFDAAGRIQYDEATTTQRLNTPTH